MNSKKSLICGALVTAGIVVGSQSVSAQSADALVDKLVEKGILSVKEANQLREEADKDFTRAYQVKTGMPDWVTSLRFNGDFRGRYEENNADNQAYYTRDRYRYRVRLGITATLLNDFEIGLRLASGNPLTNPGGALVGGGSITANQDLNSLESRKFLWIDAAYAKWNPIHNATWNVAGMFGKMDNPFMYSNMIFDYDINPEGFGLQTAFTPTDTQTLRLNSGFFVLDEINQKPKAPVAGVGPSHDPYLLGAQLLWEAKWLPQFDTALGVGVFTINSRDSLSSNIQPFYNSGNTRDAATGLLKYSYNPIVLNAAATYRLPHFPLYEGEYPIKVYGEWMDNPSAPSDRNKGYRVGLQLGKAGKKGLWELNYRYQWLEADAWLDALEDDDNGAFYATGNPQLVGTGKANGWFGGTNVRGHQVQATYSFTDYLNFTFTYYLNDLIIATPGQKGAAGHFMVDLMWKF